MENQTKPTTDNFWLFISIGFFAIIVGTASIYAIRVFGANAVSQNDPAAAVPSQNQIPSSGQSGGCGV